MYAVTAVCTAAANVRMVSAGGGAVGQRQIDRRRLARLQRAGQVHRVARVPPSVTLGSPVIDQVAVSLSVMVVVAELRAQGDRRTRGAARGGQRNRVVFVAFHQGVVDRAPD